ncbi:hypothetical protein PC39_06394 [Salinisphaera sp. PC39]
MDRENWPDRVYGAAQVAALDKRVIEGQGVPGFTLMRRAAQAAFATLRLHWPAARRVVAVCGPGNNGGDGFLVARLARAAGCEVRLFFLGDRDKARGDAARALAAFEDAGGVCEPFEGELPDADVVVDALLGTGLGRPVEGRFRDAVAAIDTARGRGAGVLAVDIPSGLDADRGSIWGTAVTADATPTFIGLKLGLLTGEGPGRAGAVSFHDLGAPPDVYDGAEYTARRLRHADLRAALPPRARHAHKGGNGHVLCVGGNRGMGGAARMAGEAALRCGAGLVSVATHADHAGAMSQARPELMARPVAGADDLAPLLERATVAAVGPGLGQDDWARALWQRMLATDLPLVVDADALNLLAGSPQARGGWVLTPHPGEAARLLDTDTRAIQADRPGAVAALADRYDAAVVLKGAGSLVRGARSELWICTAGNPGMAVGGMGDVLTGVVAAMLAQGLAPDTAARIAVQLHAAAGDDAAEEGERGLLPCDLFPALRRAANPA